MKAILYLAAVPLIAQQVVSEKERALGEQLAVEIRRQSKPVVDAEINAYVKRVGGEMAASYRFEAISIDSRTEPFSVPSGEVSSPCVHLLLQGMKLSSRVCWRTRSATLPCGTVFNRLGGRNL